MDTQVFVLTLYTNYRHFSLNMLFFFFGLVQIPRVSETCNLEAMMDGYYKFLFPLNPGNIRPIMPTDSDHESLLQSHNRESLSTSQQSVQVLVS